MQWESQRNTAAYMGGGGGGSGASNKHFLYIFKGGAGVSQKSEIRKLMEQKAF